jgi:hypothetical protein
LVLLGSGCGEDAPPLDQLPLRDGLRADPAVVASLSAPARVRLAARLEAARTGDLAGDPVDLADGGPGGLVSRLDGLRERRSAEPLVAGSVDQRGVVRPLTGDLARDRDGPLPPLARSDGSEGPDGADGPDVANGASRANGANGAGAPIDPALSALESRALDGEAGRIVRALLDRSGARRLQRVLGWPIGAVAIGDVVYVNASWLVALAPPEPADGGADAGAPATPSSPPAGGSGGQALAARAAARPGPVVPSSVAEAPIAPAPPVTRAAPTPVDDATAPGSQFPDGGTFPTSYPAPAPAPPDSSGDSGASFWDACSSNSDACAADWSSSSDDSCSGSADDGSDGSCDGNSGDGSDSACSGTADDGSNSNACASSTDDGGGAANCQISRDGRHRQRFGTFASLVGPLAFLLPRRRR